MYDESARKVITCILPKGRAKPLLELLSLEKGLTTANVHYARGAGRITPLTHRGIGETTEKEILTVSVSAELADELFEEIFFAAGINQPHGGLMYMHALTAASGFQLPDVPEEA
ncbi:MAG: hypothetical protein ACPGUC_03655 [Gammaproteobacteria bacterium]